MDETLTQTIQDYLKIIFDLTETGGAASTTALASRMRVAPASVTGMLQKMAAAGRPMINYRKHKGVTLTPAGRLAALEVIRHHRLIETYLVESLGYPWDEVHAEADRLEHFISENFEAKIAAALGNPLRDPHGELIPSPDLTMPPDPAQPLSALRTPQKVRILRVRADDASLLRHLQELGLIPGSELEITAFSPFDLTMSLRVDGNEKVIVIGEAISKRIFVGVPAMNKEEPGG